MSFCKWQWFLYFFIYTCAFVTSRLLSPAGTPPVCSVWDLQGAQSRGKWRPLSHPDGVFQLCPDRPSCLPLGTTHSQTSKIRPDFLFKRQMGKHNGKLQNLTKTHCTDSYLQFRMYLWWLLNTVLSTLVTDFTNVDKFINFCSFLLCMGYWLKANSHSLLKMASLCQKLFACWRFSTKASQINTHTHITVSKAVCLFNRFGPFTFLQSICHSLDAQRIFLCVLCAFCGFQEENAALFVTMWEIPLNIFRFLSGTWFLYCFQMKANVTFPSR